MTKVTSGWVGNRPVPILALAKMDVLDPSKTVEDRRNSKCLSRRRDLTGRPRHTPHVATASMGGHVLHVEHVPPVGAPLERAVGDVVVPDTQGGVHEDERRVYAEVQWDVFSRAHSKVCSVSLFHSRIYARSHLWLTILINNLWRKQVWISSRLGYDAFISCDNTKILVRLINCRNSVFVYLVFCQIFFYQNVTTCKFDLRHILISLRVQWILYCASHILYHGECDGQDTWGPPGTRHSRSSASAAPMTVSNLLVTSPSLPFFLPTLSSSGPSRRCWQSPEGVEGVLGPDRTLPLLFLVKSVRSFWVVQLFGWEVSPRWTRPFICLNVSLRVVYRYCDVPRGPEEVLKGHNATEIKY